MEKLMRLSEIELSLSEMSALFNSDHATVKKRLATIPTTEGPYKSILYPLKDSLDAFYSSDHSTLPALKLAREKAETRLAEAKAIKVEQENKKNAGELIEMQEAEHRYGEIIA